MRPLIQKILASLGGIVVAIAFLVWAFSGSDIIAEIVGFKTGVASIFPDGDAVYRKYGDVYTALSVVGLALVAGLSFVVVFWERRPPQYRIQFIYWSLLLVILPMSILNFWSIDAYVSRSQQAVLNLVQCLLSSLCLVSLFSIKTTSTEARVLRAFAVFFLAAQGVFVPAIFAILWWLNWEGAISLASTRDISPGWITIVATFSSLIISILQFRLTAQKQQADASEKPLIIRP